MDRGGVEARCYARARFHAKAYVVHRPSHPPVAGILGSGNITLPGALNILARTVPGERSGLPSSDESLCGALRDLRRQVRLQFANVGKAGLPSSILPRLKCVIELQCRTP